MNAVQSWADWERAYDYAMGQDESHTDAQDFGDWYVEHAEEYRGRMALAFCDFIEEYAHDDG